MTKHGLNKWEKVLGQRTNPEGAMHRTQQWLDQLINQMRMVEQHYIAGTGLLQLSLVEHIPRVLPMR